MSVKLITPNTVPTLRVRCTVKGRVRTKYFRLPIKSAGKAAEIWGKANSLDATWKAEQMKGSHHDGIS